ncbi:MAG TPA: MmoB/DmpM family protein [Candidatus Binataceae bacterium]|nr:MmoB/DmpM family protein [Candidatus Binataceae bacterium]
MSSNGHKVALKLMVGQEADAVVSVLAEAHPEAVIQRYPAYVSIEGQNRLTVEIPRVIEALGSDYDVTRFLVILSSYVGAIDVNDDSVTLTA